MGLFNLFSKPYVIDLKKGLDFEIIEKTSNKLRIANEDTEVIFTCRQGHNCVGEGDVYVIIYKYVNCQEDEKLKLYISKIDYVDKLIEVYSSTKYSLCGIPIDIPEGILSKGVLKGMQVVRKKIDGYNKAYLSSENFNFVEFRNGIGHEALTISNCLIHIFTTAEYKNIVGVSLDKNKPDNIVFVNKDTSDCISTQVPTSYFVKFYVGESSKVKSDVINMPQQIEYDSDFDLLRELIREKINSDEDIDIIKFVPVEDGKI